MGVIKPIITSFEKHGLKYDLYGGCTPEPSISNVEALADKVKNGGYDLQRTLDEPLTTGPVANLKIEFETQKKAYFETMGWDIKKTNLSRAL